MRILDRYLLRSFLSNYVLSLFVLISLYVVLDLFVNFDEFTEAGRKVHEVLSNIASYYTYNLPLYFAQLAGVITLFAGCGTLARLQRHNEITALLASGTSLYRVAAPIILAGLIMNGLLLADQEVLLPRIAPKLARARDDVEGMRPYEVWFLRDGSRRLINALQFSPGQQSIRGLYVMELVEGPDGLRLGDVITAAKARWDEQLHGWTLFGGVRISMLPEAGTTAGGGTVMRSPVPFYATQMTPEEMKLRQTAQWMQYLSVRQLGELQRHGDVDAAQIAQIRHTRFTSPIDNMILLLLGISFFLNRLPGTVLTQGTKALATCSVSFLIAFIGQQLVGSADVPAAFSAWLPIFLFGPLSVVLLDNVKT